MIHLDYRDGRPIYQQILDGFRDQIRAGIVGEGERMPSVRELAGLLAINPNTIQRAYRELESEGWIVTVAGKGSFVCAPPASDLEDLLEKFDQIAGKLLARGVAPEHLAARMTKGGTDHA